MSEQPFWSYVAPESFLFTPPITTPSISLLLYERDELKARVAELEARVPRWIPVTERLPKKWGNYLTASDGDIAILESRWWSSNEDNGWFAWEDYKRSGVTHWMELPPPPEEAK